MLKGKDVLFDNFTQNLYKKAGLAAVRVTVLSNK